MDSFYDESDWYEKTGAYSVPNDIDDEADELRVMGEKDRNDALVETIK